MKDDFDETFGGMEIALVEVQRRGKAMMNTVTNFLLKTKVLSLMIKVRRQRELLSRLEYEMGLIRQRREEVRSKRRRRKICHLGGKEAG